MRWLWVRKKGALQVGWEGHLLAVVSAVIHMSRRPKDCLHSTLVIFFQ